MLATGASFIMLAALFVDPALQLVFRFPQRLAPANEAVPTFQTTQIYDPRFGRVALVGAHYSRDFSGMGNLGRCKCEPYIEIQLYMS